MMDINTRGGVFGPGGYGGGVFDGSGMGFGGMGSVEQAAAGVRGLGAFTWCSSATPCSTADPSVTALQKDLNTALKAHGFQQITVDGKLGAATCGAAAWAGTLPQSDPFFSIPGVSDLLLELVGPDGPVCKTFTYPTPVGSTKPYIPPSTFRQALPWMQANSQAAMVQAELNNDLVSHGYNEIPVTGMLDPATCGAMKLAADAWGMDYLTAYGGNCQTFLAPTKKAPVCPDGYSVVNGTCVHNAVTSCPDGYSLVNGVCTKTATKPLGTSKASMTGWVVGGLLVAAGVAAYAATKKK